MTPTPSMIDSFEQRLSQLEPETLELFHYKLRHWSNKPSTCFSLPGFVMPPWAKSSRTSSAYTRNLRAKRAGPLIQESAAAASSIRFLNHQPSALTCPP